MDKTSENPEDLNLKKIKTIEELISQVNKELYLLKISTLRDQALEDIDIFQKSTLFKLRKGFGG